MNEVVRVAAWSQDSLEDHIMELLATEAECRLAHADPHTSFADLGIDSFAAVAIVEALGGALGRELSDTIFWDYPSPAALAKHLLSSSQ